MHPQHSTQTGMLNLHPLAHDNDRYTINFITAKTIIVVAIDFTHDKH
jgi:hypothetical protein